jgi:hypothetical protein
MSTAQLPDEGVVIIPRKIGFLALLGGVLYLVANVATVYGAYIAVNADIAALHRVDADARLRGDDIRRRIEVLERDRDRITRVEEQLKVMLEMLREVREELRRRK